MRKIRAGYILTLILAACVVAGCGESGDDRNDPVGAVSSSAVSEATEAPAETETTDETPEPGKEKPSGPMKEEDMVGVYSVVATEVNGHVLDAREAGDTLDNQIILSEGGTGFFITDGEKMEVSWRLDGNEIAFENNGKNIFEEARGKNGVILEDGFLKYYAEVDEDGSIGYTIFAKEGADLSGLNMLSPEEYLKKYPDDFK